MKNIKQIPLNIQERIEEMIKLSWDIFINHYINSKYEINLEAPFQLHFASVLKHLGEMFCLRKHELFLINLEVDFGLDKKNYVDITVSFYDRDMRNEVIVPIELKFRTDRQSAEDIGVLEIYKDIYRLEKILHNSNRPDQTVPFCYFFCITDNQRYVKKPGSGLKTVFTTYEGSIIKKDFEYKYLNTKTGREFYEKHGSLVFNKEHQFEWQYYTSPENNKSWFLSMKIG